MQLRTTLVALSALPLALIPSAWPAPAGAAAGLVTLYAGDDLACTLDFWSGGPGARIRGGEVDLQGAQLIFDALRQDHLSYGFVEDQSVRLVDLGRAYAFPFASVRDRASEYPISVFHTLARDAARFFYLDAGENPQPLPAAQAVLNPGSRGLQHFAPRLGHTYLLRVEESGREGLFKFQVTGHLPGHSLTLRWARVPTR